MNLSKVLDLLALLEFIQSNKVISLLIRLKSSADCQKKVINNKQSPATNKYRLQNLNPIFFITSFYRHYPKSFLSSDSCLVLVCDCAGLPQHLHRRC